MKNKPLTYGQQQAVPVHKIKAKRSTKKPLVPQSPARYEDTAEQQAEKYRKMQRFVRKNLQEIAQDLVHRSKHAELPKQSTYSKAVSMLGNMHGNTSMVESVVNSLCVEFVAKNLDNLEEI